MSNKLRKGETYGMAPHLVVENGKWVTKFVFQMKERPRIVVKKAGDYIVYPTGYFPNCTCWACKFLDMETRDLCTRLHPPFKPHNKGWQEPIYCGLYEGRLPIK